MRVSWKAGIAVWLLAGISAGNAQAPAAPRKPTPRLRPLRRHRNAPTAFRY